VLLVPLRLSAGAPPEDREAQCRAGTSDNIIVHSDTDSSVPAVAPKPGSLRIPLAVLDHLPHLYGAEFKVLLVLSRRQARGGGKDQKPFPYTIPQIMEDTGLCPRAISKAIARLDKHHLILRVAKYGALPNRYRIPLESAAPQKIPKAKKPARASKRPKPAQAVEVKVPEWESPPQKRTGGRRRKDSPPLQHVERANLLEGLVMDADQPDEAKADPIEVKVPEWESPPQKRTGGRRRKDSPPLRHVERANLLEGLWIDPDKPS
jgi:hypothetical protein